MGSSSTGYSTQTVGRGRAGLGYSAQNTANSIGGGYAQKYDASQYAAQYDASQYASQYDASQYDNTTSVNMDLESGDQGDFGDPSGGQFSDLGAPGGGGGGDFASQGGPVFRGRGQAHAALPYSRPMPPLAMPPPPPPPPPPQPTYQ